jgi:hypothetical protein
VYPILTIPSWVLTLNVCPFELENRLRLQELNFYSLPTILWNVILEAAFKVTSDSSGSWNDCVWAIEVSKVVVLLKNKK